MNLDLITWLSTVRGDPLAFVMGAFPWGQEGTVLANSTGPEDWAKDLMIRIRDGILDLNSAIQEAIASGHGIAKSATVAQLTLWAFCTFPDTRGVITANTETQLKTKTWAELGKWFNLCFFAREHFTLTATGLFSKDPDRERTWRIDMIPWSEKNPAAFAGLHNKGKRLLPQVRGNARNADWRAFLAWRASGRTPAPDPAPAAPEVPAEVPLWALRATLKETGKFAAIDAFVEAHKDDQPTLWEAWNMGNTVVRDSMLISQFAPQFGIDAAARDALLIAAAALSS